MTVLPHQFGTSNEFAVRVSGGQAFFFDLVTPFAPQFTPMLSKDQALRLGAWLLAEAGATADDYRRFLIQLQR